MRIFSFLLPRRPQPPHPDTPIETWIVEILEAPEGPVLNKTLIITESWSRANSRPPLHQDHQFGPSKPIVFVINELPGSKRYRVYTKSDFDIQFGEITTRTPEERIEVKDSYGNMLADAVEELRQIHARLQK
ncbi:MAG: hypothetical protein UW41_C0002G0049 [Candidatus Collierbacteria bacterium GW2011_GWC2_44_18]|uniref:Uncharacterized protein n=1 Tax=Candidatus Collierbacteria bacterium GW2011_GWC2_44_18 TaxID=1618392 RepID=A0A0G1HSZ8_9BACT|nr:MAG: hypothetical protein UW16_C0010G0030 [Microgenomates group bacterium GW2011_GWC1_44_10]KKT49773.1 MAG: hypothetical protein UW41_C0002G0049 [Candidatus Collierbacteria bacterium GW2011_GWC2_44_18]